MPTIKPYTARLADFRYQLTGCVSEMLKYTVSSFTLFAILKKWKTNQKICLQKRGTVWAAERAKNTILQNQR